jgi:uncharacterized protein (TIGR03435 family)
MKTVSLPSLMLVVIWVASVALSQVKAGFDVASIRPVQAQASNVYAGLRIDGSQAHFILSLRECISTAYGLKSYQIIGPDWLPADKFDIAAKLPDGANTSQVRDMLQVLLDERFHLKMHRESKEFPAYSLEVARSGLKLQELSSDSKATPTPDTTVDVTVTGSADGTNYNFGNGSTLTFGQGGVVAKRITMGMLTDTLSWYLERPVVDRTGLKGNYDMVLDVSAEDARAMSIRAGVVAGIALPPAITALLDKPWGDSLTNSLSKTGLRLERRNLPLEIMIIDNIDRKPTDN